MQGHIFGPNVTAQFDPCPGSLISNRGRRCNCRLVFVRRRRRTSRRQSFQFQPRLNSRPNLLTWNTSHLQCFELLTRITLPKPLFPRRRLRDRPLVKPGLPLTLLTGHTFLNRDSLSVAPAWWSVCERAMHLLPQIQRSGCRRIRERY
jgi:hypothetical protein